MIILKVNDKVCTIGALGATSLLIAEFCVAAETLIKDICDSTPGDIDKDVLKTKLGAAMIMTLSDRLLDSTEGGSTQ